MTAALRAATRRMPMKSKDKPVPVTPEKPGERTPERPGERVGNKRGAGQDGGR